MKVNYALSLFIRFEEHKTQHCIESVIVTTKYISVATTYLCRQKSFCYITKPYFFLVPGSDGLRPQPGLGFHGRNRNLWSKAPSCRITQRKRPHIRTDLKFNLQNRVNPFFVVASAYAASFGISHAARAAQRRQHIGLTIRSSLIITF